MLVKRLPEQLENCRAACLSGTSSVMQDVKRRADNNMENIFGRCIIRRFISRWPELFFHHY